MIEPLAPGAALAALRIGAELSLREVAEEAGISPVHLGQIERDRVDVTVGEFNSVCRVMAQLCHRRTAARSQSFLNRVLRGETPE